MGTNVGAIAYIATGAPATQDETGAEALTWVEIENLESFGSFSTQDNIIDIPNLKSGLTTGVKGMRQGNDVDMAFEGDGSATGQTAVRTATLNNDGTQYSIKLLRPSGIAEVASGVMHSYVTNDVSGDAYEGASFMLRQNTVAISYDTTD